MKPTFVCEFEVVPSETVSVTSYDPFAVYECDGFFCVEVPPSPKVQDQVVGPFVDRSVKTTERLGGTWPDLGVAEKSGIGPVAGAGRTSMCAVAVDDPPPFWTTNVIVYGPGSW